MATSELASFQASGKLNNFTGDKVNIHDLVYTSGRPLTEQSEVKTVSIPLVVDGVRMPLVLNEIQGRNILSISPVTLEFFLGGIQISDTSDPKEPVVSIAIGNLYYPSDKHPLHHVEVPKNGIELPWSGVVTLFPFVTTDASTAERISLEVIKKHILRRIED